MNRIFAAAGVAVVNSHSDHQGHRWKSGVKSIQPSLKRFISSGTSESPDVIRPLAGVASRSDLVGSGGDDHLRRRQMSTDESVRQAMFLNCWGPS